MNTCEKCKRQLPPGQCCGDADCPLNVIATTGSVSSEPETTGETGETTGEGAQ